jgi:hypothetical protein
MANDQLSEALAEAYAVAPTDTVILHTLEIRHPEFIDTDGTLTAIRIVRDHQDIEARLEDSAPMNAGELVIFQSFAFEIQLPSISESSSPEAIISIDNVGLDIMSNIDRAVASQAVIRVAYRPYLSTDLSGPHYDPPLHLTLTDIVADVFKITGKARFSDLSNLSFPNEMYTASRFPSLVQ